MTVTLPFSTEPRALARILISPAFNAGEGPWEILPMRTAGRPGGYELIGFDRAVLPGVGQASFTAQFGIIDGQMLGVDATTALRLSAGSPWDPAQDVATARDLLGYEVRIQLAPWAAPGSTPAWRTRWWGQVEAQTDSLIPGAAYPTGMRTYRCVDGLARARYWPLGRHSTYRDSVFVLNAEGNPGYNVGPDGQTMKNRDTADVSSALAADLDAAGIPPDMDSSYYCHAPQGTGSDWTDLQVIEQALRVARGLGDPLFTIIGNGDEDSDDPIRYLSEATSAWKYDDGDTAWDLVAKICRRERGRGLVFVDWADDSGFPEGPLVPYLRVYPQVTSDIAWTPPVGAAAVLPGAGSAGTLFLEWDLVGDHRLDANAFRIEQIAAGRPDAVETVGERIQVLATLSVIDGTAEKAWAAAYEATFAALDTEVRAQEIYHVIWTTIRVPIAWDGQMGDHNDGTMRYADFACNDDGGLITSNTQDRRITSTILLRVMDDIPLLENYTYAAAPGSPVDGGTEAATPARRPPFAVIRVGDDAYLHGDDLVRPLSIQVKDTALRVYAPSDIADGTRVLGGNSTPSADLDADYAWDALGVTVALEMPHRVRLRTVRTNASGQEVPVRRTQRIHLPGYHLWLTHSGTIWDLDRADGNLTDGFAAKRGCAGASGPTPGILRDDRDRLARLHALSVQWYLVPRQSLTVALRCCGLLPSFQSIIDVRTPTSTTSRTYPQLGQVISTVIAGGQQQAINTPVTQVAYDHVQQMTTWTTDWPNLAF